MLLVRFSSMSVHARMHACMQTYTHTHACWQASQCIVVVHYLLDTLLHQCPSRLWSPPAKAIVKRRKQTQARRKAGPKQSDPLD